jgi:LacI family transcriptional regulator
MKKTTSAPAAAAHVITLKDVARRAGYSVATASRVLNGHTSVGQQERERVLEAAMQLGYVPNNSARALRSQSTRLVGVIVPTLDHAIYARMIDGLQLHLEKAGMSVIISSSGYDLERERAQARVLVARGVEAIVLVGAEHHPDTSNYLRRAGVHQIFTYTTNLGEGDAAIGFDNRRAAAAAARYLLDLGHRRFGMIAGVTAGNDRASQRRDGFLSALEEEGIDRREVVVVEAAYNVELGRAAMQSLMQTMPRPTAVFCGSDILAAGAIRHCQMIGIDVPRQVSVMGFDNLEVAELVTPGLTTLNVPLKAMGEAAAETLMALSKNRECDKVVDFPLRLVVRSSTGPAEQP